MECITPAELRRAMNERGERCEPFVWGVDYVLTRGFICSPEYRGVLWHIGADGNDRGLTPEEPSPEMAIVSAPTREEYAEMFETLQAGLMRGDSFLANLTTATEVCLKGSLRDVFLTSRAPFRLLIPGEFVCFSPEPFVRVEGRGIATFPMKGTIDATLPDAERQLLDDYKETCEHHTITDLMRNDLNMVSDAVEVVRYRYVERVETMHGPILQTSSEICGSLTEGKERRFGDIIFPLLPAGSITGAPKRATVELIARSERCPRGWYTGVFGYFDGHTFRSAVMIRCLQRSADGRLYYHSGGGVTINSRCHDEYREVLEKVYLTK